MGKGSAPKVYDYLMSMHLGLCHGPIDALNMAWIKDKRVFCGSLRDRTNVCIRQPDLFGGDEKEGGPEGVLEYYPGTSDQIVSSELAARFDRTPGTTPGFRGLTHVFMRGRRGTGMGFKWVTNNPYLPPIHFHLTRLPRQLNAQHAVVWPLGEDAGTIGPGGDWSVPVVPGDDIINYELGQGFVNYQAAISYTGTVRFFPIARDPRAFCDDDVAGVGYDPRDFAPIIDEDGNIVPFEGQPATASAIDLGLVRFRMRLAGRRAGYGTLRLGVNARFYGGTYNEETGQWVIGSLLTGGTINRLESTPNSTSGSGLDAVLVEGVSTPPVGARFVETWMTAVLSMPIFASYAIDENRVYGDYQTTEFASCDIEEGGLELMPDANPAHMIYECMTNVDWGKGEDPSLINTASFEAAAETLFNERFGLSMGWFRQSDIESFIQEILDHIKAFLYQDPSTGLWELKLLRGDYNANTLDWLTPDNCRVLNPKRRAWGETINEIVVTYTDPNTEDEASVNSHNLANIAVQGGISSEARNYYGVRNPRLAKVLADRDVLEAGTPLWSGQIEVSRTLWQVKPGAVYRLNWPEENIANMVVRVMAVDYGKPTARTIKLEVTEDIFGIDTLAFTDSQGTLWSDPSPRPRPLPYKAFLSAALPDLLTSGRSLEEIDARDPTTNVAILGNDHERRVVDINVMAPVSQPNGTVEAGTVVTVSPANLYVLETALLAQPYSYFPRVIVDRVGQGFLAPGSRLVLGTSDYDCEVVMLISFDMTGQFWFVQRGVYDTTPKDWPIGTPLWQYPEIGDFYDPTDRVGGAQTRYRLLPRTQRGRLTLGLAGPDDITPAPRPYLPFRPADCQLDGMGFAPLIYSVEPLPATVRASWVWRNRTLEDANVPDWLATGITPEDGTSVTLRVVAPDGTVLDEFTGITDTFYDIPTSVFDNINNPDGYVEFWAVRDGMESLQSARRYLWCAAPGWGQAWGEHWGTTGSHPWPGEE